MIFTTEEQIKKIFTERPNADLLASEAALSAKLRKYVYGEGLLDELKAHDYEFDSKQLYDIKKKLAKSTRDLVERILAPVNKVYSAKGGVRIYNLGGREQAFETYLSSVRRGLSMKEWVQKVANKAADIDPMSLIHVELDAQGKAYPTYKSTSSIYSYGLNGRKPEFVIYEISQEDAQRIGQKDAGKKYYRAVDDLREYYFGVNGQQFDFFLIIPHNFGQVPAIIASDIPVFDSIRYESRLMPIYELIKSYYEEDGGLNLYKKRQMYPREWSIELPCNTCKGVGEISGDTCPDCNGTRVATTIKQGSRISVRVDSDGKAMTPIPPGGFYSLPEGIVTMVRSELQTVEQQAKDTFWGQDKVRKTQGTDVQGSGITTATGELLNERTKEPKLREISQWAEGIDRFCTDLIKRAVYGVTTESNIKYGDRYIHGTIEEITAYYEDLKAKGAPSALLDKALRDIYEASFESNRQELVKHDILMRVEPFVHNKVNEVMGWSVSDTIKNRKLLFGEWLQTKTSQEIQSLGVDGCKRDLDSYCNANAAVITPQQPVIQ